MAERWQDIATAPRDGTVIRVQRVLGGRVLFEGKASWRRVYFPPLCDRYGIEPGYDAEGWMKAGTDKRFPEPTHWRPAPPQQEPGDAG